MQQSRQRSAEDTCVLIRHLVFAATPRNRLIQATAYLNVTGLSDCRSYGVHVRNTK